MTIVIKNHLYKWNLSYLIVNLHTITYKIQKILLCSMLNYTLIDLGA